LEEAHTEGGSATVEEEHTEGGSAVLEEGHTEGGSATVEEEHTEGGSAVLEEGHTEGGSVAVEEEHTEGGSAVLEEGHTEGGSVAVEEEHTEGGTSSIRRAISGAVPPVLLTVEIPEGNVPEGRGALPEGRTIPEGRGAVPRSRGTRAAANGLAEISRDLFCVVVGAGIAPPGGIMLREPRSTEARNGAVYKSASRVAC